MHIWPYRCNRSFVNNGTISYINRYFTSYSHDWSHSFYVLSIWWSVWWSKVKSKKKASFECKFQNEFSIFLEKSKFLPFESKVFFLIMKVFFWFVKYGETSKSISVPSFFLFFFFYPRYHLGFFWGGWFLTGPSF